MARSGSACPLSCPDRMPDRESRPRALHDTGSRSDLDRRGPARHELPAVDEAALHAARQADRLVAVAAGLAAGAAPAGSAAAATGSGTASGGAAAAERWLRYFELMPDRLRDDEPRSLRQVALRARAAY